MIGLLNAISCGKIHPHSSHSPEEGLEAAQQQQQQPPNNTNTPHSPTPKPVITPPEPAHTSDHFTLSPTQSFSDPSPLSASASNRSSLPSLRPAAESSGSFSLQPPTPVDGPPGFRNGNPFRIQSDVGVLQEEGEDGTQRRRLVASPQATSSSSFPPSPNLSVNEGDRSTSPSPGHHRRTSSTGSRSYKETLNAYTTDSGDGTRTVNQYVLQGRMGRGSYATVERARDTQTGIEYAIKEFSKNHLRRTAALEAQRRERFSARGRGRGRGGMRGRGGALLARPTTPSDPDAEGPGNLDLIRTEIAIMKKVDHPNVATVHEVIDVTSDDALLIVMEMCAGGPIMKMSQGKTVTPMDETQARSVFNQLVLGLAYLHFNQIVHRDIKPENCLFMEDRQTVKLIDFGISKFTTAPGDQLDSQGSPAFMPPELLPGHPENGHPDGFACDVWSLGATLYALVCGKLPFDQEDPTELFKAIKEAEPSYPETLSLELCALLSNLLSKSPAERPTLRQLWDDAWVTKGGPLEPSYEENCQEIVEPNKEEMDEALRALRGSMFMAAKAASKFKGLLSKRRSISGAAGGAGGGAPGALTPDSRESSTTSAGTGTGTPGAERHVVDSPQDEFPGEIERRPSLGAGGGGAERKRSLSPSPSRLGGGPGGGGGRRSVSPGRAGADSPLRGLTRMEELKLEEAD